MIYTRHTINDKNNDTCIIHTSPCNRYRLIHLRGDKNNSYKDTAPTPLHQTAVQPTQWYVHYNTKQSKAKHPCFIA